VSAERIKSWPTKERPRERLLAEGPGRLTDAELLAIILRIGSGTFEEGVPGTNAYEAALSILRNFDGYRNGRRAHPGIRRTTDGLLPPSNPQFCDAILLSKVWAGLWYGENIANMNSAPSCF
jgi:DNA repair protein RadC